MYERLELCPSCSYTKFQNHLICEDHSVTSESFALVKCEQCELVFTNPRPTSKELPKYYESSAYISHTDRANSLLNFVYKQVRSYTLKKKRSLIQKHQKKGTVLDYGCGTGDFLRECVENGWNISGVEPNDNAREIASTKTNHSIESTLENLAADQFDIITAWHVIEHVTDLKKTLLNLTDKLSKQGKLIIAVPNLMSYDSLFYKQHWAAYDVPRHLYHFSQKSFSTLIRSLDLKLVETQPMKFDSYYVSMLSEQYRNNKNRFLSAFRTGYQSNKYAAKSGEYSSLIYVLKKKN